MMDESKQQKPSKEYLYALLGESSAMVGAYFEYKAGKKTMTQEQKDAWNERKDWLRAEIKRVRALI